ncbi:asparagine synthase (glutamine-hydrolyzing) [Pseudalkalibacillus berkeleyi]|uniref:asparagine synthase (glutamine-hydrolyzing) n=1 Tax=Pseudalkalibacillus berkeleyi TaxID=1069813 RepID=A0ABS9H0I1_9BACL|nr:asparagine synthase (glutamine-hydrolyzing) [Pseudalkalibacillus berkeleyi]MCF6138508.1 asparagine synthase (glutamine-hydrolyzing) [Pseudalkalibacillus berkeleyi]
MCGFVGYVSDISLLPDEVEINQLQQMTDIINHRGPDDEGHFYDEYVRFGFRRLSIIDLESGHQPLSYEDDRYWIIFNGEIYNYVELRNELLEEGYVFKTNSDTEVILANFVRKGVESFKDLRGMFGFLIWDKETHTLTGARDPFGIKPFFYLEEEGLLYCASEKKSILTLRKENDVDPESLHHYLTYQFVPEPSTMSVGIKKLSPGHYFTKKPDEPMSIKSYWLPTFRSKAAPLNRIIEDIQQVMRDSVRVHMRSDVPVGSFLSGGIDSSAIVALAREVNPNIKTFTVGFEREGYSEIDVAVSTAASLNVENIHYIVQPEEFVNELPKIIWYMDDPVADPAAIPLYFVAREARKHVKVVLSGEGADELFGGYTIYNEPNSLRGYQSLPQGIRTWLRKLSNILPEGTKGKSFLERGSMTMEERYIGNAKMFTEKEKEQLLNKYNQDWHYQRVTQPLYDYARSYEDIHKMQYVDMHTWLRGDILVKADRMTMANSLELRVPFLDKEVFKVASQISSSDSVTNGTTKYALREAMKGIVPDSVLYRRKLGFPVPIRHWLKNELYEWAKDLITKSPTEQYLDKNMILGMLEVHRAGKLDYSRKIWTVITFMIWHQIYIENLYHFHEFQNLRQYEEAIEPYKIATS